MERSCNSLKRQAQKAARYKRLKERERDLEQRLIARRAETIQERRTELAGRIREIEDRLQEASARLAQLEAGQTESQSQLQEFQKAYHLAQTKFFALKSELDRSVHDRDMARERMTNASKRQSELERELTSLDARGTVLADTLTSFAREAEENEATLARQARGAQHAHPALRRIEALLGRRSH